MIRRAGRKVFVTGEYSACGYAVFLCQSTGVSTVYTAGNDPQDSQVATPAGVGLRQMRRFCLRTCREIAGERRARFGGVSRVSEEEKEHEPHEAATTGEHCLQA